MGKNTLDKIKGVLYGQAIGDALGLGTEFMSKQDISLNYPDKLTMYSQIIDDNIRSGWKKGEWTDDTEQMLCIMDSILDRKTVNVNDIADRFCLWAENDGRGMGNTVYRVISTPQFTQYPHKAAELIWKLSHHENAANGALMRTSVLGIWQNEDVNKVVENTIEVCKITHADPRCIGSCVILTSIISAILREDRLLTLDEIIAIGEKYDSRIKEYVLLAQANNIAELKLADKHSVGYTLKAMSAALWVYFNSDNFEDGLIAIVNEGGDADTNAAIACSLLGAKFGYDSTPDVYKTNLVNRELLDLNTEKMLSIMNNKL